MSSNIIRVGDFVSWFTWPNDYSVEVIEVNEYENVFYAKHHNGSILRYDHVNITDTGVDWYLITRPNPIPNTTLKFGGNI